MFLIFKLNKNYYPIEQYKTNNWRATTINSTIQERSHPYTHMYNLSNLVLTFIFCS